MSPGVAAADYVSTRSSLPWHTPFKNSSFNVIELICSLDIRLKLGQVTIIKKQPSVIQYLVCTVNYIYIMYYNATTGASVYICPHREIDV